MGCEISIGNLLNRRLRPIDRKKWNTYRDTPPWEEMDNNPIFEKTESASSLLKISRNSHLDIEKLLPFPIIACVLTSFLGPFISL